jgi:predicted KAP-like P-loop ATPase
MYRAIASLSWVYGSSDLHQESAIGLYTSPFKVEKFYSLVKWIVEFFTASSHFLGESWYRGALPKSKKWLERVFQAFFGGFQ